MSSFQITEPGFYKTRDGRKVAVDVIMSKEVEKAFSYSWPVAGIIEGECNHTTWCRSGYTLGPGGERNSDDIVAKWEEPSCVVSPDKLPEGAVGTTTVNGQTYALVLMGVPVE